MGDPLKDYLAEMSARPTVADVLAKARSRPRMPFSSVDIVREMRDGAHPLGT